MSRRRTAGALVLLSFVSSLAEAKVDRVLHEPIPEDLYKGAPTNGQNAARGNGAGAATGGGQAGAPSPRDGSRPDRGAANAASSDTDQFTIDRDTRRPNVLPYSDPFEPSVAPFKRLHAYDTIDAQYVLAEGGEPRHEVTPTAAAPNDIVFVARLTLVIESGVAVRLPTPGPGAHLLAIDASLGTKPISVVVRSDSADNWDLEATATGTVTITMRVATSSEAFGGDFGDPRWDALPGVPALPARLIDSATQVTRAIGVSRTLSVRDATSKLVAYFRSFQESDDPPPPSGDIYLDLALSKKGVCRHRAFAFFVTARSLGLPTRMITNEAHAWVEVHNGQRWKRIDLGGAGGALEAGVQPPMTPPPDPFAWPESANRGTDLASRAAQPGNGGGGNGSSGTGGTATTTSGGTETPQGAGDPRALETTPELQGERAEVLVLAAQPSTKRGGLLPVRGTVSSNGRACGHAAVVVSLREQHGSAPSVVLGTVSANESGAFESSVFVPRELPPGDYEVVAQSQADSRCAQGVTPK